MSVSKRQASQPDNTLSTMSLLESSRQLTLKSQQVSAVQTVGALTACLSFDGRQASRLPGTLRSLVRLHRHIWTHHFARQALQQKWRRHARWPTTATWQLNPRSFFPVAVESHRPLCEDAHGLYVICPLSDDVREVQFLYQRISVVVQRFNAMLLAARQFFYRASAY